jgi:Rad3-related DNA helicase
MPCGTGKTMSMLALVVSYHLHYGDAFGKLFYLSRTVPEMEAVLGELKRLHAFVLDTTRGEGGVTEQLAAELLGVGLSSRAQLCVNAEVNVLGDRGDIDGGCRLRDEKEKSLRLSYLCCAGLYRGSGAEKGVVFAMQRREMKCCRVFSRCKSCVSERRERDFARITLRELC